MKITVLVENSVCSRDISNVKAEHGLSLHIELNEKKILFDTGQSNLFIQNSIKLGIDLSDVDYLIVSHGHVDHGGGLKHFLDINKKAKIFLHKTAVNKFYTKLFGFIPIYVGLDKSVIDKNQDRIQFVEKDFMISDNISIIQNFPEIFPRSEINKTLYERKNNIYQKDSFIHEIGLVLKDKSELSVFTACSHSGLPNMIGEVKRRFNNANIKAVFGGFHINNPISKKNASKEYINKLIEEIDLNDSTFYTGHCTGKSNFAYMKSKLGEKIHAMNSGNVINY